MAWTAAAAAGPGRGDLDALEQAAHRFVAGIPLAIKAPKWTVEVFLAPGPACVNPRHDRDVS